MGRRKGTGCILRRPNAEGLVRGFWTDDVGKRHWVSARSHRGVERILAERIRDHHAGLRDDGERTTVGEYLGRWLSERRGAIKDSTWVRYEELCRLHVVPVIGHVGMRQRLVPLLKSLQKTLVAPRASGGHGISHGTLGQIRRILHKAFEDARFDGTIARDFNPMDAVENLVDSSPVAPPVVVDEVTARTLIAAAWRVTPRWAPLFILIATTSVDVGCALAARREDYDRETGLLATVRSVRRVGGKFVTTTPKRLPRVRDLPLDDLVGRILGAHLDAMDAERAAADAAGRPWPAETCDLIFPREDGRQKDPGIVTNHVWQQVLEAAGLPRRSVRLKDFRSTVASLLMETHDEALVQLIIGHSPRTQTLRRHYLAASVGQRRAALSEVARRVLPLGNVPQSASGPGLTNQAAALVDYIDESSA